MSNRFRRRFPIGEFEYWAGYYSYGDDSGPIAIGARAAHRGHYTRDEFSAVAGHRGPPGTLGLGECVAPE